MSLPSTMRALQCESLGKSLVLKNLPTPTPTYGSLVVKVLALSIEPSIKATLAGKVPFLFTPTPVIPGARAVGRVAAIGPDTTTLQVGQLVMIEPFIRARDNPTEINFVLGVGVFGDNAGTKKLCEDVWRNGSMAEYINAPLENVTPLNEKLLLGSPAEGGFEYSVGDLTYIARHLVSYGGFRGIDLKPGETVIVAPATGSYSSAAVDVASAIGAKVIAMGRNMTALKKVAAANQRVSIVQNTGNFQDDLASLQKFGPIDAYLDISPAAANGSTHIRSCLMALKHFGRASLMGVTHNDIDVPLVHAMLKNLTIRCQYMYEREDVVGLVKLVESGALKLGKAAGHDIKEFSMDQWDEALEVATSSTGPGKSVVILP